ncbi:MAG: hypothetical protein OXG74_09440 [Acidobacteria bacterium]|nr:hypothetical protein [Acidobacteriota bacterium]
MKPDEAFARRLAAEIRGEFASLALLEEQSAAAPRETDTFSLRARGSILHDFYNGIERVFVRIAEELNGGVPKGEQWHRQLLRDMSLEIPGLRPAVIDEDLERSLGGFLRFRHVFRNVYGFALEEKRMRPLEDSLPAVLGAFRRRLDEFLVWMVGEGDGSG